MITEADTCRKFVVPRLQEAGWDDAPCAINEQRTFTDGRILFVGGKPRRGKLKRADYILRYRPDYPIAIVEAKPTYKKAADGIQQAKDYAQILGLHFAYATNGHKIIEADFFAGTETVVATFPKPDEPGAGSARASASRRMTQPRKCSRPAFPIPPAPFATTRKLRSTARSRRF